jgi:hypothetical protein
MLEWKIGFIEQFFCRKRRSLLRFWVTQDIEIFLFEIWAISWLKSHKNTSFCFLLPLDDFSKSNYTNKIKGCRLWVPLCLSLVLSARGHSQVTRKAQVRKKVLQKLSKLLHRNKQTVGRYKRKIKQSLKHMERETIQSMNYSFHLC